MPISVDLILVMLIEIYLFLLKECFFFISDTNQWINDSNSLGIIVILSIIAADFLIDYFLDVIWFGAFLIADFRFIGMYKTRK